MKGEQGMKETQQGIISLLRILSIGFNRN